MRFDPGFGFQRGLRHDAPLQRPSGRRLFTHFWPFLRQHWIAIGAGTACVGLALLCGKVNPLIVRYLVDTVFTPAAQNGVEYRWALQTILLATSAMLAISVITSLITRFRMRMMRRAGARMVRDIRMHVYSHLQKLSLRYYESRQTGDIMSRVTGDVGALEGLITQVSDRVLGDLLNLVVTLGIIIWLDWRLALVAMIPIPLLMIVMQWFAKTIRPVYRQVRDRMGVIHSRLQDHITGIRVIKAFNTESAEAERFRAENHGFYSKQMEEVNLSSNAFPLIRFVDSLGGILVTAVGGYWLIQPGSTMTIGDFYAFSTFVLQLYTPIGGLFHMYNSVLQSLAAGERVADILEVEPDIHDREDARILPPVTGRVTFHQVDFHYTAEVAVLKEISFSAAPGEIIALVGPSGTGKTSIINLLLRFYDPVAGRVEIDGVDLRSITQSSLRSQIAVVLQDTLLFNGTVLENIRYATPEASMEAVREAARAAHAEEFIEGLPQGYATEIGERGVKLSGGQKQRIAIARALLTARPLLILDEATSMIDSQAENIIQEALSHLMKGRTSFVIAHRLSTITNASRILVIEDGRITESGGHDELYARGGSYRRMVDAQFRIGGDEVGSLGSRPFLSDR